MHNYIEISSKHFVTMEKKLSLTEGEQGDKGEKGAKVKSREWTKSIDLLRDTMEKLSSNIKTS